MMILRSFSEKAINELLRQIDQYPYISFDIFDTFIKRDCYKPTELFRLMKAELNEKYHMESHFASLRPLAEREAICASSAEEVTLDEIYSHLHLNLPTQEIERSKRLEQDLEYEFCQWNPLMKSVYE